jgi:hypothetical protein
MALGDGIRRNIASVEPTERAMLRDALVEMNQRHFPGTRTDTPPGGVTWWFKQDETHQATHVHGGPEFLPWHREIVNRLEAMLRQINPQLSLHYWDWTQDPTSIPNANLGGGATGSLDLFTADFMGGKNGLIGEPWLSAGYYVPGAANYRSTSAFDPVNNNPADPPRDVSRIVGGLGSGPESAMNDGTIVGRSDYAAMRSPIDGLEAAHNRAHGFVNMGSQHTSFRDPFVFLLHSNVDRLFARWQTDPTHPDRLDPTMVYGSESADVGLNGNIEPWSGGTNTRPWAAPENEQVPKNYKHPSIVFPPCYDTNQSAVPIVEVLNAGTPPAINFNDVPSGETTVRAAVFRIYGCGDVTVRVKAGLGPVAPFSVLQPASGSITVHHGSNAFAEARIWIAYTAGAALVPVPDGAVTFECPENGKSFAFVLKANAITRPTVAVMLALDQSWSMSFAAGTTGATRVEVLKDAARKFMELIQQDNGVGLIRFDHNSYAVNDANFPGLAVTPIASGNIFDPGRVAAVAAVNAHAPNPAGSTSVGDGVDRARQVLNALPPAAFQQKALIVLTDGLENDPLWISDVTGSIDDRTFAIGLGNEQQVNTAALNALANSTGGYLLLTGLLSSSIDDYFRLSKYFLQILAGVTNTNIIVDPSGFIAPGTKVRIPFRVTEADIDCTPLLMTDYNVVDFALEAPDGTVITQGSAAGLGISAELGTQTRYFRFNLPVAIAAGQHAGMWHALLEVNGPDFKKLIAQLRERKDVQFQSVATHGARYCFVAQSRSNLKMLASLDQSGYAPGADLGLRAVLTEYDLPVAKRARVSVELTRPGGSMVTLSLLESDPGIFEATTKALTAGIYLARFMAQGVTLRGRPFTREHLATAAVWRGGDNPYQPPGGDDGDRWCRLLSCLLSEKTLTPRLLERLKKEGLDVDALRNCMQASCRRRLPRLTKSREGDT